MDAAASPSWEESPRILALAGNPNVGKSTVFNALTGLRQHTGNWAGKTVASAQGICRWKGQTLRLVDLPGCYSLLPRSPEEEAARDFLLSGRADAVLVVCDATCLERSLGLVLQVLEITPRIVVCVNLLDEAKARNIQVDTQALSQLLGVPVVGTAARRGKGIPQLLQAAVAAMEASPGAFSPSVPYPSPVEGALDRLAPLVDRKKREGLPTRWTCLRLLEGETPPPAAYLLEDPSVAAVLQDLWSRHTSEEYGDAIAAGLAEKAADLARRTVCGMGRGYSPRDRALDQIFTGKWTAFPVMGLLLLLLLWLTMVGANVPSQLLSQGFAHLGTGLRALLEFWNAPAWLTGVLVDGAYTTLSWVVAVMLPPMAIFFPLFTLLEDLGYLPRIAFNLDRCLQACGACGKQALTTCMGLGCNAAGVTGCRIIDSPRERNIALLTNSFIPCNGRLPLLVTLISLFFAGGNASFLGALLLAGLLLLALGMSLAASKLLAQTLLRGEPSSFTLELPPYRTPQVGQILVRSLLDRTLFVLGRAAAVAAPAGVGIWCLANLSPGGESLLSQGAGFLDPFARLLGMDGVILLSFLLALPANELVLPLLLMGYLSQGTLTEVSNLSLLHNVLVENGWTWVTALCVLFFSLFHWPCSTTCLTVWKETKSLRWTATAFLLPTLCGMALCALTAFVTRWIPL